MVYIILSFFLVIIFKSLNNLYYFKIKGFKSKQKTNPVDLAFKLIKGLVNRIKISIFNIKFFCKHPKSLFTSLSDSIKGIVRIISITVIVTFKVWTRVRSFKELVYLFLVLFGLSYFMMEPILSNNDNIFNHTFAWFGIIGFFVIAWYHNQIMCGKYSNGTLLDSIGGFLQAISMFLMIIVLIFDLFFEIKESKLTDDIDIILTFCLLFLGIAILLSLVKSILEKGS